MSNLDKILQQAEQEIAQIKDLIAGLKTAGSVPAFDQIAQIKVKLELTSQEHLEGSHPSSIELVSPNSTEILSLIAQGIEQNAINQRADVTVRMNKLVSLSNQAKAEWANPTG